MAGFREIIAGKVNFSIDASSPCPCGSEKPAGACCSTPIGLRKLPIKTAPNPPKSGVALSGCYASALNDCGTRLTREHYISETLLHHLNKTGKMTVSGFPWCRDEEKMLPPDAFAAKVLCERHNAALSRLDDMAVRLFEAFDESHLKGSHRKLLYLFSGDDFERWLLKILCGLSSSKNLPTDQQCEMSLPPQWLDILFGSAGFQGERGLYICTETGHRFDGPHGIAFRAISRGSNLSGLGFFICGYEFILSTLGFPSRQFDGRRFALRPLELYSTGFKFEKSVVFSWSGKGDYGTIHTELKSR